ncbi:uncharacterized protein LOC134686332 [Mytilus trossulus]|uniref:uncharacterized protein LOC134686332 n=1 Tax=Mytilus trossulus TaxID=6551 RepID=UPI003005F578
MEISIKLELLVLIVMDCMYHLACLSGHVCTRERAENYLTSYNQAFICQERYTTSCGHLDWRRCTKYRIQTCFTPKQKYAIRYHQIEACCSGWREDGSGKCTVPTCSRECQNGGSCVAVGNMPGCLCQEGFHGDTCQHAQNEWKLWHTVAVSSGAVFLIIVITLAVVVTYGCKRTGGYQRLPQKEIICLKAPSTISTYTTTQTNTENYDQPNDDVCNTVYPSAPHMTNVPDSIQKL